MKASSPAPDYLVVDLEAFGDLLVVEPLGGVEDELRALHLVVGERVAGGAVAKLGSLLAAQLDLRGGLGHLPLVFAVTASIPSP